MGVEVVENGGKDKPEMSQVIRHYCKVCNRGFNCAGALGGHMRAHVIGDVGNNNVNHPSSHGYEHLRGTNNNKHSYFLRAKTTRFMGYHEASNDEDGEFKKPSSSFGRFGGVEKERVLPMLSSQGSKSEHFDHESYSASSEEEDLANCLVMLSNKSYALSSDNKEENKAKEVAEKGLFQCKACKKVFNSHQALGGHRASHKKVKGCFAAKSDGLNEDESNNNNNNNNVDEDSIQEDHESFTQTESSDATGRPMSTISSSTRKRPKMHECSVCRRVFSSGQALGGHKRCHWLTTSTDNAFIPNFQDFQYDRQSQQLYKKPMLTKPHHDSHHDQDQDQDHDHDHQLDLNLNLPAPGDSDHKKTSRFEASTRLYLKQLAASANHSCQKKIDSTVAVEKGDKLRKLSDLRDVSLDGGWLQMGIASTTDIY